MGVSERSRVPRYYIDSDDGNLHDIDDTGFDLPGPAEAREMAITALPDLARDKLPDGDRCTVTVRVRDERDTVLYSAALTLVGEWHAVPPTDDQPIARGVARRMRGSPGEEGCGWRDRPLSPGSVD